MKYVAAIAATGSTTGAAVRCPGDIGANPETAKNTAPAAQMESAGSATLNSVRYRRRSCCFKEIHRPLRATVSAAGAGPKSRIEANTNTSDTDTVAGRPGILIANRLQATVSTASAIIHPSMCIARRSIQARARAAAPPAEMAITNAHRPTRPCRARRTRLIAVSILFFIPRPWAGTTGGRRSSLPAIGTVPPCLSAVNYSVTRTCSRSGLESLHDDSRASPH